MAAGKRKKKVATNPQRGFATTSLPSKKSSAEPGQDPENHEAATDTEQGKMRDQRLTVSEVSGTSGSRRTSETNGRSKNPECEVDLDTLELETLLDKHGSKSKTEASQEANKLETERRTIRLRAFHIDHETWLSDHLVNSILSQGFPRSIEPFSSSANPQTSSDDDLLLKSWVLRQVLTRLQVSRPDDALTYALDAASKRDPTNESNCIWGLEYALEWVAANDDFNANPDLGAGAVLAAQTPPEGVSEGSDLQRKFGGKIPAENSGESEHGGDEGNTWDDRRADDLSDSMEDEDPSESIGKYLQAKAELFAFDGLEPKYKTSPKRIKRLRERVVAADRDILFESDVANKRWEAMLPQLRKEIATKNSDLGRSLRVDHVTKPEIASETSEVFDIDAQDDEVFANIFEPDDSDAIASAPPPPAANDIETCIRVEDFGTWNGNHPKKVLSDIFKLSKNPSQIRFSTISSSSHANRLRLNLSWSKPHEFDESVSPDIFPELACQFTPATLDIEMRSIATATADQAQAYLSTLALYFFFPHKSIARLHAAKLPPVWRQLFWELAERKANLIKAANLTELRDIQRLLEARNVVVLHNPSPMIPTSTNGDAKVPYSSNAVGSCHSPFTSDQAQQEWTKRANSAAFRSFLPLRQALPIYRHRAEILQMFNGARVSILCSETGSGKSTQIPSYILEERLKAGKDCRILVTQPRRISTTTLARRVSQELGESAHHDLGTIRSLVGYTIRMDSKLSKTTRITFATTGVLLRMLDTTSDLEQYDVLVLDEVHERTLELDLIFIALKRLLQRNRSLKVVLMSATINTEALSLYFSGAPTFQSPGRTFPLEVRFLEDAVEEVVDELWPDRSAPNVEDDQTSIDEEDDNILQSLEAASTVSKYSSKTQAYTSSWDGRRIDYKLIVHLASAIATKEKYKKYSQAILIFMPGLAEIRRLHRMILEKSCFQNGWLVHLLHSTFSTEELERAFEIPPKGTRKVIISTNIAETGVTIPDITSVVDTCKEKVMRYDDKRQVSKLREGFISRSACLQRRGRAARVQEGLCFHLVTRHRYERWMSDQHTPEMLRLSLQSPILQLKLWNLGSAHAGLAEAIQPPTAKNIRRAVGILKDSGALTADEKLTPLGRRMALLPLDVELAKLCMLGAAFKCLDPAVTIAALISSRSPYTKGIFGDIGPSLLYTCSMYNGWKKSRALGSVAEYCHKNHLSSHALSQIEEQKMQLLVSLADAGLIFLSSKERSALRYGRWESTQAAEDLMARYGGFSTVDEWTRGIIAAAFYPRLLIRQKSQWRNVVTNQIINETDDGGRGLHTTDTRWLTFGSAKQDKNGRYQVSNTSEVPQWALAILLGQNAEFHYYAQVIRIDGGRIELQFSDARSMVAVRRLREQLTRIADEFLVNPQRGWKEVDHFWFDKIQQIARLRITQEENINIAVPPPT